MRLFYGLSLPQAVRAQTAALADAAARHIPGRYSPAENHHLTLCFIGEVDEARLPMAQEILARCAAAFPAPAVTIDAYSYFGRAENAILILAAQSDPTLSPLHEALKAELTAAGLPCDPGPFSPHVTLARKAQLAGSKMPAAFSPICFAASCAHLYLSARDDGNILRYTPIFSAPFAESAILEP